MNRDSGSSNGNGNDNASKYDKYASSTGGQTGKTTLIDKSLYNYYPASYMCGVSRTNSSTKIDFCARSAHGLQSKESLTMTKDKIVYESGKNKTEYYKK